MRKFITQDSTKNASSLTCQTLDIGSKTTSSLTWHNPYISLKTAKNILNVDIGKTDKKRKRFWLLKKLKTKISTDFKSKQANTFKYLTQKITYFLSVKRERTSEHLVTLRLNVPHRFSYEIMMVQRFCQVSLVKPLILAQKRRQVWLDTTLIFR